MAQSPSKKAKTGNEQQELFNAEYKALAEDKSASGNDSTCLAITMQLGYTREMLKNTPKDCQQGIMCGCPPAHLDIKPGMQCLDLGSGAGTDVILCAQKCQGSGGKAIGLDILTAMTERAAANAAGMPDLRAGTAEFKVCNINKGEIGTQFAKNTFDVVTSNCCVCLFVQEIVFPNIFDTLKPGGTFCFAESMQKAPHNDSDMYKMFREAFEKNVVPAGRDASCKGFRASMATTHDNPMTATQISDVLKTYGFVDVEVCAALLNPQGLSPKPLPAPVLTSETMEGADLKDFNTRFAAAWSKYKIDEHVTYVCIKARKPPN